jgi:hypothetical protein
MNAHSAIVNENEIPKGGKIAMTFERWGYKFDGAYTSPDSLQPIAGVYVIFCRDGDRWTVLDVGESDNVRDRLSDHERVDC